MIDDELMRVWTRENPAPDLVVHMVLCSRIHTGEPWGKSKLSRWSGLTDYKARQAIKRAEQWMEAWNSEINRHANHLNAHQSSTNPGTYEDESTEKIRKNPTFNRSRARSLSSTGTNTPTPEYINVGTSADNHTNLSGSKVAPLSVLSDEHTDGQPPLDGNRGPSPPKGGTRGKNIGNEETRELWQALNDKRKQWKQGARALKLTPQIASALVEALRYATPDEILHAYDWYTTAKDARWWQDHGCDLITFCRKKHLGEFINKSGEWSIEIEKQQEEIDDLPF
jgi:hypothetical protein